MSGAAVARALAWIAEVGPAAVKVVQRVLGRRRGEPEVENRRTFADAIRRRWRARRARRRQP